MEQKMILISRGECERMLRHLTRAEYYCAHARFSSYSYCDLNDDGTITYPGAVAMPEQQSRDIIQTIRITC